MRASATASATASPTALPAAPGPVDPAAALQAAEIFRVLADPSRLRILSVLAGRELCVHQLARAVGMSQPAVSHHLRILRHMRLVSHQRRGRHIFYRLDDDHVESLLAQAFRHAVHHPAQGLKGKAAEAKAP